MTTGLGGTGTGDEAREEGEEGREPWQTHTHTQIVHLKFLALVWLGGFAPSFFDAFRHGDRRHCV